MPVSLHINDELALHLIRFDGQVKFAELGRLAMLHGLEPEFAAADTIHIVAPTADLSAIAKPHLDQLRECYRALHTKLDLMILRRAAWICDDLRARAVIEYWLAGRHSLDGQGADICLVSCLSEAHRLFDQDELEAAASLKGFRDFAHFSNGDIA